MKVALISSFLPEYNVESKTVEMFSRAGTKYTPETTPVKCTYWPHYDSPRGIRKPQLSRRSGMLM